MRWATEGLTSHRKEEHVIKINEGPWDRALRITLGAAMVYLGLGEVVTGGAGTALWIVGLLTLLTGVIGWCAVYALLGIDTTGRKSDGTAIT